MIPQAQPQLRAAHAAVLGEADAAVRQEFASFDVVSLSLDDMAKLSKYELGQSALPLGALVRLARKSARMIEWILTGQD